LKIKTGEKMPIERQDLIVLIVEDETPADQVLSEALITSGLATKPLIAHNGQEALVVTQTIAVDLILTDGHMPKMSGPELIMNLRERNFTGQIIAMTGDGTSENNFNQLGVDLLLKPYRLWKLIELINQLCPA
jgi:CheY-like chemotaxis protein